MSKLKEIIKDENFIRLTIFVSFNALLLYILFFAVKNIGRAASLLLTALSALLHALTPVIIGIVLAYILAPLVEWVSSYIHFSSSDDIITDEKLRKRERYLGTAISFILITAALSAVVFGLVFLISGSIRSMDINAVIARLDEKLKLWIDFLPGNFIYDNWIRFYSKAENMLSDIDAASLTRGFLDAFLGVIASVYLLADRNFFIRLCRKLLHITLPQRACAVTLDILHEINGIISSFLRGIFIDSLLVALLSAAALSVAGIDFAVFIGLLAGVFNVIPYFGPLLGMIPAFISGIVSGDIMKGILAVIILFAVQQLDSNFIYPKVVGKSTGLKPLFVLAAVSAGGYFAGIAGMILSVPAAGIISLFVTRWAIKKEKPAGKTDSS